MPGGRPSGQPLIRLWDGTGSRKRGLPQLLHHVVIYSHALDAPDALSDTAPSFDWLDPMTPCAPSPRFRPVRAVRPQACAVPTPLWDAAA